MKTTPTDTAAPSREPEPRKVSLARVRAILERRVQKGILITKDSIFGKVDVIPTGVPSFDKALSIGGFPRGFVTELFGPPGAGKSTLCMQTIAQAHLTDRPMCGYIDFEHTFSPDYAKRLGVGWGDDSKFILSQPDCLEDGLEVVRELVRNAADLRLSMIVIDSIAAMAPRAEVEGDEAVKMNPGLHSRLISQFLKAHVPQLHKNNVLLLCVNQIRHKIGMMGSSETTPGGESLKHYATMRVEVRRTKLIELKKRDGELLAPPPVAPSKVAFDSGDAEIVVRAAGARSKVHIVKSKVGNPYRAAEASLFFGKGFDVIGDFFAVGTVNRVFKPTRSGMVWKLASPGGGEFTITFQSEPEFRAAFEQKPGLVPLAYKELMKLEAEVAEVVPVEEESAA